MFQSVHWANEQARNDHGGVENVRVVLWDYEARQGKAMVKGGHFVDVYVTDYVQADLAIGVKNSQKPACVSK
jgi:hypothetical protein